MPTTLNVLSTTDELDLALARSSVRPIVIFKHSPTCGISAQAFESISEWLSGEALEAEFFVVRVQASRDVSMALAERVGVRHESPQVIVIQDGQVAWHGSHFRATAGSIVAALDKLVAAT